MTYVVLNLVFLGVIIGGLLAAKKLSWTPAMTGTMIILLVATAIFDSVLVGAGIVAYDEAKILGLRVGDAPVEDFFYAVLAGILIPIVWRWKGVSRGEG